ncbi:hypothetical protein [Microbacterium sp. NPDC086615]|uniref:hypothetical protein n=1 Tax=Microbacterium sp. NPDC086615 TaxID=3154865 RepID=UPI003439F516
MPGLLTISAEDTRNKVYLSESVGGSDLIRVHYRIARLSGETGYTLAHFSNATDADRKRAVENAAHYGDLDHLFERLDAEGALFRRRFPGDRRRWLTYGMFGNSIDDPLVQLELEMMIDAGQKVVS